MKIGFVQFSPVFGQVAGNLARIGKLVGPCKADLLVLPELCLSGYNFLSRDEVRQLSETSDGPSIKALKLLSRETGTVLVAGFAEQAGRKIFNSSILIRPSGKTGIYRKTHLFSNEKKWFSPGDTGFRVWPIGRTKVGMMICFDWIFPESARTLALMGARVICHPANLVLPYCPDSMPVRALENRVFSVTANRTGRENRGGRDLRFIGQSVIAGPDARVLSRASAADEGVHIVEIDPTLAADKSITPLNDLFRDRRPGHYRRMARR
jgi:predicted amidohydrolase